MFQIFSATVWNLYKTLVLNFPRRHTTSFQRLQRRRAILYDIVSTLKRRCLSSGLGQNTTKVYLRKSDNPIPKVNVTWNYLVQLVKMKSIYLGSIENIWYPNGEPNWGTYFGGCQNQWLDRFLVNFGQPKTATHLQICIAFF